MTSQLHDWQPAGVDALGEQRYRCAHCAIMRDWALAAEVCPRYFNHRMIPRHEQRPLMQTSLPPKTATRWPGPYRDEAPRVCVGCRVEFFRPVSMRRCDYCGPACKYRGRRASIQASQKRTKAGTGYADLTCKRCLQKFRYDAKARRLSYCSETCSRAARLAQRAEYDRERRVRPEGRNPKCS